ncbi:MULTISPECIES: methionine--tRNA ligase [unclassified Schaalia]|uniref:methionine--tRNA ligase n=1 Tax=unclassified Schaalia TaxID=2691889 RepID=UPI001E656A49|nr:MULTISPECIES: methionine--tRNA ligase [unclassified Schaalia]MCD4549039.1 methionine--tRNA ligase [Schaalia sp. lx-260]MCD4557227.1 methionine--tRNA ligase [Schaalia sp. lx-100]
MSRILSAVAWPYANGPRHIGHVAGFGVPSDVFSRYMRMAGHEVLMVSGTDEHGTPILVAADAEGISARELADRNNRLIVEDLVALGLSYDLFTRTTAGNHYAVVQEMFEVVRDNGYMIEQVTRAAISPSTGRTLPDRYIEGTCPICSTPGARGDQCDACGNQLDPTDLIDPHSRINGEKPQFVESTHWFLDLPALADALSHWLNDREDSGTWRPNVIKFSQNFLNDIRPRAMTRDIDWGIPVPGWEDQPTKRLYVWFDAVIGYLSASIEWARRQGDPQAWRQWWNDPEALSYYFMGKDNIVFHSQIWPAELLGYNGQGSKEGQPKDLGVLNLPTEVVSSEFLTMEGKKFSSSHGIVIYVRDFLQRYQADALRYFISAAGPETSDADFTWAEFVRRTNGELVAGWGNLVNRTASMIHKKCGAIPEPGPLQEIDEALLAAIESGFAEVGDLIRHHRQKAALGAAMRLVAETNKYITETEPFKLKAPEQQERLRTVLWVLAQAVSDLNTMLSPFLPHAANAIDSIMGGAGDIAPMPRIEEVAELDPDVLPEDFRGRAGYPIITGDYEGFPTWERHPVVVGREIGKPSPVFVKLDESIIEEELARYADMLPDDVTGA